MKLESIVSYLKHMADPEVCFDSSTDRTADSRYLWVYGVLWHDSRTERRVEL